MDDFLKFLWDLGEIFVCGVLIISLFRFLYALIVTTDGVVRGVFRYANAIFRPMSSHRVLRRLLDKEEGEYHRGRFGLKILSSKKRAVVRDGLLRVALDYGQPCSKRVMALCVLREHFDQHEIAPILIIILSIAVNDMERGQRLEAIYFIEKRCPAGCVDVLAGLQTITTDGDQEVAGAAAEALRSLKGNLGLGQ